MRGGHDELERRSFGWLQIEVAIGEDIGLDSLEHTEPAFVACVELVDLAMLRDRVGHADAAGDWQSIRVIRDAETRVTEFHAALDHPRNAFSAIAPRGMSLKITAVGLTRHDILRKRRAQHALQREVTQVCAAILT